jgi:hypothetical protein
VVRVTLPDGTVYPLPGKVDFFDVQVDPGTDTVTVRADFANPERVLVDGQFVNVRVERGTPVQMLVVPQAAVQLDQAGPYVLVVGGDNKVEARRITPGAVQGPQVVVQSGLKAGDKVIIEGIQKARPGMAVAASEAPASPTAGQGGGEPAARAEPAPPRAEPGEAASEAPREKAPPVSGAPAPPQGEPDDAASEAAGGEAPAVSATPQVEPGAAASQTPSAPRLPEAKPGGAASEPVPQRAQ